MRSRLNLNATQDQGRAQSFFDKNPLSDSNQWNLKPTTATTNLNKELDL